MIEQVFTYSEGIQCVCSTADGLWIAHQGGLSFLDPASGRHLKWTTADGIPAHPVLHLTSDPPRLAMATPNGVAWTRDTATFLGEHGAAEPRPRWERALAHPQGCGAYLNGVAFVQGRIHAATGGGRVYREGNGGFELLQLPLPQARLLRLMTLESTPQRLRLLLISNNSGVLLLATGAGEEPSLYQWSEEEGLASRYVTALEEAGEYLVVGVHGCIHVARRNELIESPQSLSRWGRVTLSDLQGPAEHGRVHALCMHEGAVYAGTSAGLYRVDLEQLGTAAADSVAAAKLDDAPVRHLASHGGDLWCVLHTGLGRFVETSAAATPRNVMPDAGGGLGPVAGRSPAAAWAPRITTFTKRWRFVPDGRWRHAQEEPESSRIVCMAATPEGIVCGGESGRVLFHDGERWRSESLSRQRRSPEVHSLAHDPDSYTLWGATRHGLFVRDSRGRWMREVSFPGRTVHQLLVWEGNLLALGSAGLHVFSQGAWSAVPFPTEPPSLFLACSGEWGLLLAGRPGGGYFLWRPDAPHPEPFTLGPGRANCMAWEGAERLWIGTDRGLSCWSRGRLELHVWGNDAADHVTAVSIQSGRIHVGSQGGVWIASLADLANASGESLESRGQRLGVLDGLPHPHVTSLMAQSRGLWVGTQGGLARLV